MVSQAPQQLVAGHASPQLRTGKTSAGHDKAVTFHRFPCALHPEPGRGFPHFLHLKPGFQRNIRPVQGKPKHIHHRVGLVGVRIYPSGFLRHGKQAQSPEPFQGFLRPEALQGLAPEVRLLSMVAPTQGMEVRQIAPSVSRGLELSAHPSLPLQQHNTRLR